MAKILIVDDEPRIRELIREHLQYSGYICEEAADGTAALTQLSGGAFDLVILDLGLPDMDGLELIQEVRSTSALPIIVISARTLERSKVAALDLGADVVIQSVHKTLPSLTQTALLHIKCNRPDGGCYADRERIDRYIHMVQSSSPSYVLMASIENSIYQMEQTDTAPYGKQLYRLRRRLGQMRHLRLADTGLIGQAGIRDLDISKIVVSTRGTCLYPAEDGLTGFTGAQLDDILRREYHLEMEMCGADYVTAITTPMDRDEGLRRLGDALTEVDARMEFSNNSTGDTALVGLIWKSESCGSAASKYIQYAQRHCNDYCGCHGWNHASCEAGG